MSTPAENTNAYGAEGTTTAASRADASSPADARAGYDVLLKDGTVAHLRPLRTTDRAAVHALLDRVSKHSAYLRFFTPNRASAHTHLDALFAPDYKGYTLLAFVGDDLVAVAERCPPADDRAAEVAFLVDDRHQVAGLGTLLLEHLAAQAQERDVRRFTARVFAGNLRMLDVFRDAGFATTLSRDGEEVEVSLNLTLTPQLLAAVDERDRASDAASVARLLRPRSVAVIGAGRDRAGLGHRVLRNLVAGGFHGPVYPVNPHAPAVAGLTAYPSVDAVPGEIDFAVIAVPAPAVVDAARACARRGAHALVVISAGFAETGAEGARREAELVRVARHAGMRLVGPNCLGICNTDPAVRLDATFFASRPVRGPMAVASQSGAVGAVLVDRAGELGLGISSFVSLGNKADVSGNDLLLYWERDPVTEVIGLYLESFGNPRKFARIARRISARKPIIVVKSGTSAAGSRAVSSHTAAAASPDVAVDALLRRAGVVRVPTLQAMLDVARLLVHQPLPRGRRVAIVGNSGGPGALAADACDAAGLTVPELEAKTQGGLRACLGATATVRDPVDLTADGDARRHEAALDRILADAGVDAVLAVYTPPFGSGTEATSAAIARAAARADKPVVVCLLGHDGAITPTGGPGPGRVVPAYAFPEQAVAALAHATWYAEHRERLAEPGEQPPMEPVEQPPRGVNREAAQAIVAGELAAQPAGRWLDPATAGRLLRCYGLEVIESVTADGPETAADAAAFLGFPVALKASGPRLVHKSDVGGVRLGLATPGEVAAAYREMAAALGEAMTHAVVQPMVTGGVEIVIGAVEDPSFGPLVMFGMGGVATELLGDRTFQVAPLTRADAAEMVRALRCSPLLFGYRGRPPVKVAALEETLLRVALLADDLPEVAELDLNPVIASARHAAIVDVKVRLAPAPAVPSLLRRRLR